MSGTLIPLAGKAPDILGAWLKGATIAGAQESALHTASLIPLSQAQTGLAQQQAALTGQQAIGAGIGNQFLLARLGILNEGDQPASPLGAALGGAGTPINSAGAPSGGATGSGAPVQSSPLAAPAGQPAPMPAALAGTPYGGSEMWGYSFPAQSAALARVTAAQGGDVAGIQGKLFQDRQAVLANFASGATDQASWDSGLQNMVRQGYMTPERASYWYNRFDLRQAFLNHLASASDQLGLQKTAIGAGTIIGPNGLPTPYAPIAAGQGAVAGAESAGKAGNAAYTLKPGEPVSLSPAAAAARGIAPGASPYASGIASMEGVAGNPGALNASGPGGAPSSSAVGNGQFLGGPNNAFVPIARRLYPQQTAGMSDAQVLAMRSNPTVAAAAIDAYGAQNAATLKAANVGVGPDGTPYEAAVGMAHRFGPAGAEAILRAPAGAALSSVLSPAAIQANPTWARMTVGQAEAPFVQKFGLSPWGGPIGTGGPAGAPGAAPAQGAAASPASGAPAASPASGTPAVVPIPGFGDPGTPPGLPSGIATAAAPGGGATLASNVTPGAITQQKVMETQRAKYQSTLADDASGAVQQNTLIDQMRQESTTWQPGNFAGAAQGLTKLYDSTARAFGAAPIGKVGDWETFNKNAMQLTTAAVRAISSRAAVQEFTLIRQALPSQNMSPQALGQVFDELQGLNDWRIAKAAAMSKFAGTEAQFNGGWNQNVSPIPFIVRRMSNSEAATMGANLYKTPQGRAALQDIVNQSKVLQDQGVFAAAPALGLPGTTTATR